MEDEVLIKQLSDREIKKIIKKRSKDKKKQEKQLKTKDKCFFDKTRICNHTCKSHSHNEALGGVRMLQWAKLLFVTKGYCKLLKMMDEGKLTLKEAKSLFEGGE